MLLATLPDEELQAYLQRLQPEPFTTRTETNKLRLTEIITAARESGVVQTIDQAADGVNGTASAIRDAAGTVIGAIIVAAPSSRLQDRGAELAQLVLEEAATISRSLGFRTPSLPRTD